MRDYWIFGYASLMWYPGFKFEEAHLADLQGGHRALCVWSKSYRGTRANPGLVFGLDAGGTCRGMAYRISRKNFPEVRSYLRRREMTTFIYREAYRPVVLLDGSGRHVRALTYVVNCFHPHYVGRLPCEYQAHIIRTRRGKNGRNLDYFTNTVHHLRDLHIYDKDLERVCAHIGETRRKTWDNSHKLLKF